MLKSLMANHPRRNWRRRWSVDLDRLTATHDTGAVFHFPFGRAVLRDPLDLSARLAAEHGAAAGAQVLARLEREAVDVFNAASAERSRAAV